MSFLPSVLSTWKPPPASDFPYPESFAVGEIWTDPNWAFDKGGYSFTPLTIKDLACPTWGLGRSTSADGSVITTIGPPWLPLFAPPMELFSLDQTWVSICTGFIQDRLEGPTFLLFDPPIALTRGSGLVPLATTTPVPAVNSAHLTTVPEKSTAPSTTAAKPANSPTGLADPPARTAEAGRDPTAPSSNAGDPATLAIQSHPSSTNYILPDGGSINPPSGQDNSVSRKADSTQTTLAVLKAPSWSAPQQGDPANQGDLSSPESIVPAGGSVAPPSGQDYSVARESDGTQITYADPKSPSWSAAKQGGGLQSPTPGLGALIYDAFEKSGPENGEVANQINIISVPTSDVQEISIGRNQVLSIDPSGVEFQGKTYSIDGSGITLSNSVYTVVVQQESGIDMVNADRSSGDSLHTSPTTLTIAGQTIIPIPTGFIVNSATISPGGAAQTIDGTIISLGTSGTLIMGSSTIPLLAHPTRIISLVSTNGLISEAESSLAILDGVTISPGTSAVTVDGNVVSLETGGSTLDVGTSRFMLRPTGFRNASGGLVVFTSGQGRGLELSWLLLSFLGGTLMALTM